MNDQLNQDPNQANNMPTANWEQTTFSEPIVSDEDGIDYGKEAKNRIKRNTLSLLAVCAVSVGGIFLFGLRHQPKDASAEEQAIEQQVDMALAKLVGTKQQADEMIKNTETMVDTFYELPTKQQVSANELQTDPFWLKTAKFNDDEMAYDDTAAKKEKLKNKVEQLSLQSVVSNPVNAICQIDNDIFRIGDPVAGDFVIKAIKQNYVVLTANDMEFILEM